MLTGEKAVRTSLIVGATRLEVGWRKERSSTKWGVGMKKKGCGGQLGGKFLLLRPKWGGEYGPPRRRGGGSLWAQKEKDMTGLGIGRKRGSKSSDG